MVHVMGMPLTCSMCPPQIHMVHLLCVQSSSFTCLSMHNGDDSQQEDEIFLLRIRDHLENILREGTREGRIARQEREKMLACQH